MTRIDRPDRLRRVGAEPFRAVHRAHLRRRVAGAASLMAVAAAVVAFAWVVPAATAVDAPVVDTVATDVSPVAVPAGAVPEAAAGTAAEATSADAAPAPESAPDAASMPAADAAAPPSALPQGAGAPDAASSLPSAAPSLPGTYDIAIDATGYQAEVDRCLWVRMDLEGSVAPIVGAHNTCGGDLVLTVQVGDVVTLTGQGLDGRYIVSGDRVAYTGQGAGDATAGLTAAVILQTCYFGEGNEVRLVTLRRLV